VACGSFHSLALTDAGYVLSWGSADGGALGQPGAASAATGAAAHSHRPRLVDGVLWDLWPSYRVVAPSVAVLDAVGGEEVDRLRQEDVVEARETTVVGDATWVRASAGWVCTTQLAASGAQTLLQLRAPKLPVQRIGCGGSASMAFTGQKRAVRNWLARPP
jgi:hypothetical protein